MTGARLRRFCVRLGVLIAGLGAGFVSEGIGVWHFDPIGTARAQEHKGNTVRPEIGKPIQAALDLLKHRRGKDALAKLNEAEAVPNKTPYEEYLVQRVRGQAAASAGHPADAAHAFEATAGSSAISAAEKLQFLAAAAGQYYAAKDYRRAAELGARYFKAGGSDKAIRTVYIQALYLGNDFTAAGKELLRDIEAEEQAGRTPAEDKLQLLASVYLKQHDSAGYANALEKLVAFHPKKEYWAAVVFSVGTRSGFSERLALDFARLKLATGTMRTATEYLEAAQLSLQAGYPAEAKKMIEQGYAAGLLGTGPEADRHRRLRDMATRNLAEDQKALGKDEEQAATAKEGEVLLNIGLNYVLNGRADRGLEMMEQGMRKKGIKRPDDARLHLGYAYHVAGQNRKAIQVFKAIHGADGTASLAHLWVLHLGRGA